MIILICKKYEDPWWVWGFKHRYTRTTNLQFRHYFAIQTGYSSSGLNTSINATLVRKRVTVQYIKVENWIHMSKNQMAAPLSRFGVLVAQLESIVSSSSHKSPEPLLCFDLLSDLISAIDEDTKVISISPFPFVLLWLLHFPAFFFTFIWDLF